MAERTSSEEIVRMNELRIRYPSVVIEYWPPRSAWLIEVDGVPLRQQTSKRSIRYFASRDEAINWVRDRGLIPDE